MPESTCLHIQDRESGPIRVVELPWISVRIGRAAYCEIRLLDDQVAEEACRLTRRGRIWSLVPTSEASPILLEGRPLDAPCPLPFDVPFRMGPFCLTLRQDVAAEPAWELYPATGLAPAFEAADLGHRESPDFAAPGAPQETSQRPNRDPDRWRASWKAAEAHFQARAARLDTAGPRPAYSPTPEIPKDARRPRAQAPTSSSPPVGQPPRAAPTPSTPRIEPIRNVPRPEPKPAVQRLGPSFQPAPWPAADRPEVVATPQYPTPAAPASVTPDVARVSDPLATAQSAPPAPQVQAESGAEPIEAVALLETEDWTDLVREAVIATTSAPGFELPTEIETDVVADDVPTEAAAPSPIETPEEPTPVIEPTHDLELAHPPVRGVADSIAEAMESSAEVSSPLARNSRRRGLKERTGNARRGEPAHRTRDEFSPTETTAEREQGSPIAGEFEFPSVRDILVNHKNSPGPRPAVERPQRRGHAVPTVPQEPGHWELPGWLALPPAGIATLAIGILCCVLSWWWAMEASSAAVLTARLMNGDGGARRRALPPGVAPSGGGWIRTTAEHLADWAIYTADIEKDEHPPTSEVGNLAARAVDISPLNPTARLAMAQLEGSVRDGSGRIRGLGLSRDSVSLAWSARKLMESGKKAAALRLYSRAISAAVGGGLSRSATPRFADEPTNRYYLPAEDKVRDIIAELASQRDVPFRDWSRALPRHPTVLLATARLLRERGDAEAESLLDDLLGDGWKGSQDGTDGARLLAARAEALGLRSRWKDAADQYRQAIELADNDLIRRSWWFNLADIAQRLNDEGQRQAAFRAVLAAHGSDHISRRVGMIQRASEARLRPREGYGSLRAN